MKTYYTFESLEHPEITYAVNLGGRYWDEESELEWEKQFTDLTDSYEKRD